MLVESTGTYGNEPKTLEAYSRAENSGTEWKRDYYGEP